MSSTIKEVAGFAVEKWQSIAEPEKEHYTADDMIDAYFKGKETMVSETRKFMVRALTENINKTIKHRNELFKYLKDKKYHPEVSYLRIKPVSISSFEILIMLPEEELLKDNFLDVYEYICKFEENVSEDLYAIHFSFTNSNKDFDENQLEADGFILKYTFTK